MSLLKTGACFTQELKLPANKTEIAKTFKDCAGADHVPGVSIPSCAEQEAAIAASHQTISISGSTITLSGGGSTPSSVAVPAAPAATPQTLSISGQNLTISGGNTVTLPAGVVADGSETKVTAGTNVTVTGAGTTASPYIVNSTAVGGQDPYANTTETRDGTATDLIINPYDLYLREHMPAQSNLGLDIPNIPTPGPGDSMWGENTLGEVLHYAPGLGWQIVDHRYTQEVPIASATNPAGVWGQAAAITAPRAGLLLINAFIAATTANAGSIATAIFVNGVQKTQTQMDSWGTLGQTSGSANIYGCTIHDTPSYVIPVNAGDIITCGAICTQYPSTFLGGFNRITYLN